MTNPPVDFGRQSLHRYKEKPAAKKRVSGNEQSRTSGSQVTQGRFRSSLLVLGLSLVVANLLTPL